MKHRKQVQGDYEKNVRDGLLRITAFFIMGMVFINAGVDAKADVGRGAVTGAAVGGFLGLVLGDFTEDVVDGTDCICRYRYRHGTTSKYRDG